MTDTLLAVVPRKHLNLALAAFHRGGFGRVIRVVDPERAALRDQLARAGVGAGASAMPCDAESVVVFVHAPERAPLAAAIAVANGATAVELVRRGAAINDHPPVEIVQTAQQRRMNRVAQTCAISMSLNESAIAAD